MARVWIEDRQNHNTYTEQVKKAKGAGRKPPGRWRVRWYDPDGKLKAKVFAKKSDAENERTELEKRLSTGTYLDPVAARMRFKDATEAWFSSRMRLKDSTRRDYQRIMDNHVVPRWGTTPVDAISHEAISRWLSELYNPDAELPDDGERVKPYRSPKGKLGASRLQGVHNVLSMVLDWAVMTRRIAVNPAADIPLPRKPPSTHQYLTHKQVTELSEKVAKLEFTHKGAQARTAEYRVLVLLLAYTGLRWGEVSALKVGRVDLTKRRIHIVEAYSDDNGRMYTDTPKSHKQRSVPVPAFLVPELVPLMEGREPDELVFRSPTGGPMRGSNFRHRVFRPAVKAAGLPEGFSPHKLRHTAASLAIASGADVKVVQTMLGHASATMTLDTYGHLFPDRLDEVADAMDARRTRELGLAA
jgi:integrase